MKKDADYQDLIDFFTEEKLRNRYHFLFGAAEIFIQNRKIEDYVIIHKRLLFEIVVDYFADIKRLKGFHEIDLAEPCKIAGYSGYWIVKRKPLYLTDNASREVFKKYPLLLEVNEWFAVSLMISIVYDTRKYLQIRNLRKWNEFYRNLHYYFTYRIISPQSLDLIMSASSVEAPHKRIPFQKGD